MKPLITKTGGTGYVNQGTDPRIGGIVGDSLAKTQRALSYHGKPPTDRVLTAGNAEILTYWPPFISINVAKADGTYASFRAGWRYDKNWNGYIADVILKGRMNERVHY